MSIKPKAAVYFCRLLSVPENAVVTPTERQQEIISQKSARRKAEKYTTWKLLEYAAADTFSLPLSACRFTRSLHGKWTCDRFFFSLSHAGGYAAVAVSDAPIGVDIEEISAYRKKNDDEACRRLLKTIGEPEGAGDLPMQVLRAWTRRESIYKAEGTGAFGFSHAESTTALPLRHGIVSMEKDLYLSVCGRGVQSLCLWQTQDAKTAPIETVPFAEEQ